MIEPRRHTETQNPHKTAAATAAICIGPQVRKPNRPTTPGDGVGGGGSADFLITLNHMVENVIPPCHGPAGERDDDERHHTQNTQATRKEHTRGRIQHRSSAATAAVDKKSTVKKDYKQSQPASTSSRSHRGRKAS